MKIQDMLSTGVGVLLVSKVEVLVGRRGKRKDDSDRSFRLRFSERKTADTFPILICRDSRYGQTGATYCERKGPTAYSILFLVGFIKDFAFRRIILKCVNEPSTKALQDAVIHACVGVEVIPQGPPEGDHMANNRVEMAVREVNRQCRTLRISAEQNTSVRIEYDSPITQLASSFCSASHEQDESRKRRKDE